MIIFSYYNILLWLPLYIYLSSNTIIIMFYFKYNNNVYPCLSQIFFCNGFKDKIEAETFNVTFFRILLIYSLFLEVVVSEF